MSVVIIEGQGKLAYSCTSLSLRRGSTVCYDITLFCKKKIERKFIKTKEIAAMPNHKCFIMSTTKRSIR
jgi:hypothetical protein